MSSNWIIFPGGSINKTCFKPPARGVYNQQFQVAIPLNVFERVLQEQKRPPSGCMRISSSIPPIKRPDKSGGGCKDGVTVGGPSGCKKEGRNGVTNLGQHGGNNMIIHNSSTRKIISQFFSVRFFFITSGFDDKFQTNLFRLKTMVLFHSSCQWRFQLKRKQIHPTNRISLK